MVRTRHLSGAAFFLQTGHVTSNIPGPCRNASKRAPLGPWGSFFISGQAIEGLVLSKELGFVAEVGLF